MYTMKWKINVQKNTPGEDKVIIKKPDAIQSVFKDAGKACVIISFWYLNFGTKSFKEIPSK